MRLKIDWKNAYWVEAQLAEILSRQEQHGWMLDVDSAHELTKWLRDEECELTHNILPHLPLNIVNEKPLNRIFKKDGTYQNSVMDWVSGLSSGVFNLVDPYNSIINSRIIQGPFTRISFNVPSLSSQDQLKKALDYLGWVPDEWNYKKDKGNKFIRDEKGELIPTSPKITESSLDSIKDNDGWGKDLVKLLKVQARLKFFGGAEEEKGLLQHVRKDGRVPSEVVQCGTNTGRGQHRKIANVPRPGSFLGSETRSLFICPTGTKLVGTDYSQLESRIMAHAIYLYTKSKYKKGDTRFRDLILSVDDLHTYLWDDLRDLVSTRSLVKNINYAFPYGAQAPKLGSLCDLKPQTMSNKQAGERVLEVMQDKFPGLVETRDATMEQAKSGWLPGLDGRKIYVRSAHSAFNAKAQGWGAEVVKMGIILRDKYVREAGIKSQQVGWFHDEWQCETAEEYTDVEMELSLKAVEDSGTFYNFSCPMVGDSKVGANWAETH